MADTTSTPLDEARAFWRHMPGKGWFFALLGLWLVFFQFLGNSVQGYINTSSLLQWMYHQYSTSGDDGHGMFIPFVVVGLLYWKREELMAVPKQPSASALVLVALALFIHVAGYVVQFPQVSIVGFYFGIYALTGVMWGWGWLRASFFPMLLLAFGVPLSNLGEAITLPMRIMASQLTVWIANIVLGIDVVRVGTALFDVAGKFKYDVDVACAGIRSLTSLLALSTVFAFMSFKTGWRRVLVIFSAFPLAVAGNVFRLVCIIIAADAFGEKAGMFVHDNAILSLLPYVPAIIGLMAMGRWLRESPPAPPPAAGPLKEAIA